MTQAARLPESRSQLIDRADMLRFTFDGKPFTACAGDTIASALYAAGVRTFSRSFKYHRRRGLLCVSGDCPNCMVEVDSEPNVRACRREVTEGLSVRSQNRWPSLEFDLMSMVQLVGRFLPPGFYYKAFMRPRALWPAYERFLRHAAGLGRVGREAAEAYSDKVHQHAEVTVVGGGPAGMTAALAAADQGARTLLLEDDRRLGGHLRYRRGQLEGQSLVHYCDRLVSAIKKHARLELVTGATALGYYDHGWIGAAQKDRLLKVRTQRLVVATGAREIPLVFRGNDLPGVMLPGAAQRLMHLWGVLPGERAVVVGANRHALGAALDLHAAGVELAVVLDLRQRPDGDLVAELEQRGVEVMTGGTLLAARGRRQVEAAILATAPDHEPQSIPCDLILAGAGFAPVNDLILQAGGETEWNADIHEHIPSQLPGGIYACGEVTGVHDLEAVIAQARAAGAAAGADRGFAPKRVEGGPPWTVPSLVERSSPKSMLCYCEDVTRADLRSTVAEGYESAELLKRYSTVSMGPCQGKMCNLAVMHTLAQDSGRSQAGLTTSRPPARPVAMRALAGRRMDPVRRTPIHAWHAEQGAQMMVAGAWMRPEHYGDPEQEVRAVRERVGLIDVSTLGKFHLHGPDVPALLERVYTNRWRKLGVGRVRYGLMVNEEGVVMDDGVTARLSEDLYYMSATSSGAEAAQEWMEWWLQSGWELDVHLYDATELRAAVNLTGPHSRRVLSKVAAGVDLDEGAFPYMHVRQAQVADAPALLLRIGFTGELGYEIHTPSGYGLHVWEALMQAGAEFDIAAFGVEAQRVLRLEKGHLIVGQDTDSLTNPFEAGLGWAVKLEKPDFLGKPALVMANGRESRRALVGFEVPSGQLPEEANQIVRPGNGPIGLEILGRVTSVRRSPTLNKVIGLAWLPPELSKPGTPFSIRTDGNLVEGRVVELPFYDPGGARLR